MLFLTSCSTVRRHSWTPQARSVITFWCIIRNGSDIFNANHMFPNPVTSFTYPHNAVRSKNSSTTYAYALTTLIWGGMCTGQEQHASAFAPLYYHPTSKRHFPCGEYYWYTSQPIRKSTNHQWLGSSATRFRVLMRANPMYNFIYLFAQDLW